LKDVLSQNEIDRLISSLGKGELDLKSIDKKTSSVRVYDFKKPKKLSYEQNKTLLEMHGMFARLLTPSLSSILRTYCNAGVQFTEEQTYFEYINSLPSNVLLCTVPFLSGTAFLEFSNVIANIILDRILGGKGDVPGGSNTFSDMEYQLMKRVIKQIIPALNESWSQVSEKAYGSDIVVGGQYDNIYSPNEITVIISLTLQIGKTEGYMNICIPYVLMEPVIKKLSRKNISVGSIKKNISLKEYMQNKVNGLKIEIKGVLGHTKISFEQAASLKVGDVIRLDGPITKGVDMYMGNKEKYNGIIGVKNGNYAVKIQQINDEKEIIDGNNDTSPN